MVLKTVKAMRVAQAHALLKKLDGNLERQHTESCLNNLWYARKIVWIPGGMFTLPVLWDVPVDKHMQLAIDVMLDLAKRRILSLTTGAMPYKLCFLADQHNELVNFAVVVVEGGEEATVNESLRRSRDAGRTVIFLLSEMTQAGSIEMQSQHYFATKQNGALRYFAAEE